MVSKKLLSWLIISLSALAFLTASAIKQDVREARAILMGIVVSGILVLGTRYTFGRIRALHYPCLYYTALLVSLEVGFLTYTLLAPFLRLFSGSVKLIVSTVASTSIVGLYVLLTKLLGVSTLPWRGKNHQ